MVNFLHGSGQLRVNPCPWIHRHLRCEFEELAQVMCPIFQWQQANSNITTISGFHTKGVTWVSQCCGLWHIILYLLLQVPLKFGVDLLELWRIWKRSIHPHFLYASSLESLRELSRQCQETGFLQTTCQSSVPIISDYNFRKCPEEVALPQGSLPI